MTPRVGSAARLTCDGVVAPTGACDVTTDVARRYAVEIAFAAAAPATFVRLGGTANEKPTALLQREGPPSFALSVDDAPMSLGPITIENPGAFVELVEAAPRVALQLGNGVAWTRTLSPQGARVEGLWTGRDRFAAVCSCTSDSRLDGALTPTLLSGSPGGGIDVCVVEVGP